MVRVELTRLLIDERRDEQAIVLRDEAGRELPIGIGIFEASIIDRILQGKRGERPFTHDLMSDVVSALGARIAGVEIIEARGPVYFARLVLVQADGTSRVVDCRPSDGVALALRVDAPISVDERLLPSSGAQGGGKK